MSGKLRLCSGRGSDQNRQLLFSNEFELDTLLPETRPRLATWVMQTNDIHKVANTTDLELGSVQAMSRGTQEWQITIPPDGRLPLHRGAPAVILWKDEVHPAPKLDKSSVSLVQRVGHHSDARQIIALLNVASFEGPFSVFEPPAGLTATFQKPKGQVVIG